MTPIVRLFGAITGLLASVVLAASGGGKPGNNIPASIAPVPCPVPAPSSAAGFTALWDTLPLEQWGAGDIGLSVPVGADRSVWLYGDTWEAHPNGFVHSTAITQTGGCLHVSHAGAQVLPNDDATHIYWVHDARPTFGGLLIRARSIALTGTGPWDFRDNGYWRTALAWLSPAGDLTFARWATGPVYSPAPDPGPMIDCEAPAPPVPHHYCYDRFSHPEYRLADGNLLVTTSQNWDDATWHGFDAYRPIFSG